MRVYLDQDGVLADFNRGLLDGHGIVNCAKNYATKWGDKSSEQRKLAQEVVKAMEVPGFFENLPMMEGADKLWMIAGPSDCIVLTALPNLSCDARVAREKRNWLDRHFGQLPENRVITCLKSEKSNYATTFDDVSDPPYAYDVPNILVDDDEGNCSRWGKAGGISIHFKNMQQAIEDLNNVLNKQAA